MNMMIITRLPFLKILMEIKCKKIMLNDQTVPKPYTHCIISEQYLTKYFFYFTENQVPMFWHTIVISVGKEKNYLLIKKTNNYENANNVFLRTTYKEGNKKPCK
jgi:hypothetical protein